MARTMSHLESSNNEQKDGITQINSSMVSVSDVTQQNAASAEQVASSSEQLNAQAQNLKDVLLELANVVYGAKHGKTVGTLNSDGLTTHENSKPQQGSLSIEG